MKEISITPNYFDTFQFQENTLFNIKKPSRRKKNFISENIYVGNLDPAVMTLPFGGDTVWYKYVTNTLVATPTFTIYRNTALGTRSMLVDMLSVQQRPR